MTGKGGFDQEDPAEELFRFPLDLKFYRLYNRSEAFKGYILRTTPTKLV